ncbi:MAG TPA: DUF4350 domain-containing protein [Myxococcales bacterium]|nr:DUF4350 domain-containing protein [Myxococcales bacterium]
MSDPAPPRSPSARDHFPLLVIAGLALLGFVVAAVIRAADRGNFADALSTYRSDPRGARALYLFAEESGLPVRRLQRDLELVEPQSQLVLLAVDGSPELSDLLKDEDGELEDAVDGGTPDAGARDAGPAALQHHPARADAGAADGGEARPEREGLNALFVVPVSSDERKSVLEHVSKGATLLYAPWSSREDSLLQELKVSLRPSAGPEPEDLSPAVPSVFTADVSAVRAPVRAYLDLPPDAVPLLDDEEGDVVMAVVPHGRGQVVVLAAPDAASNQWLAQEDNAQLWLSTLQAMSARGPVAFDEYHHGFTSERSVAELATRYGLHFAIGQLLLGLCLWAGALKRFGRPRAPPEEERLAAADALSAISRIYREGRHCAHAAQQILRGLVQDLAPLAGRRTQDGWRAVCASLQQRGRADLSAALNEVAALADLAATERDVEKTARAAALARRRLTGA